MSKKYDLASKLELILEGESNDDCVDALRIVTSEFYSRIMAEEEELDFNLAGMTPQGNA